MEINTWNIFDQVVTKRSINRILMYGKPGTGKTSKACLSAGKRGYYSIPVHEESSVSEILGFYVPKGKEFVWQDGLGIKAWKEGKLLVINEIDNASGSVLTALNTILDDKSIAKITLPNGEDVTPNKHFKCIATMNGSVEDLPPSLADRFELKLNITEPCQEAIETLPTDLRPLVLSAYSTKTLSISFREIKAFAKLRDIIDDDAYIVFGELANDVKTILKLGERTDEITDEKTSEDTIESDTTSKFMLAKQLESYWNKYDFGELQVGMFIELTDGILPDKATKQTVIDIFNMRISNPDLFEELLTNLYETIAKKYNLEY